MKHNLKVYSTEWCGNCREVKKFLDDNGIEYEVVDLDKHPEEADAHNIDEMPVIIAYKNGKEDGRWDVTKGSVVAWVNFLEI